MTKTKKEKENKMSKEEQKACTKLDLYWKKLCSEHDIDHLISRMFDELKERKIK